MQLSGLLDLLSGAPAYRALLTALRQPMSTAPAADDGHFPALEVLRAARPYVLATLTRDWPGPVIYVTARIDRAYNVSEQLPVWLGANADIHRFAEPAPLFYERAPWGESAQRNRLETLAALMPPGDLQTEHEQPLVVTSARALMQRTLPVKTFRDGSVTLKPGARWTLDKLLSRFLEIGYEAASLVVEPGTFTRRGGILDIFPVADSEPTRIEFFDDEIERLRRFDPATQRSTGPAEILAITPAREALPDGAPALAEQLADWFAAAPAPDADPLSPQPDAQALTTGAAFPFIEHYLPYLYPNPISLLDYAPDNALIVIEDWDELEATVNEIAAHAAEIRAEKVERQQIAPDHPQPYLDWAQLTVTLAGRAVVTLGGWGAAASPLPNGTANGTEALG
ncbi:MAG: hypothetical protein GYB67_14980, partial [Chloroflexi bacterium]|nr:hypothetical protein [Chloroflexota bacterium]